MWPEMGADEDDNKDSLIGSLNKIDGNLIHFPNLTFVLPKH